MTTSSTPSLVVRYTGPLTDATGYGEDARRTVALLRQRYFVDEDNRAHSDTNVAPYRPRPFQRLAPHVHIQHDTPEAWRDWHPGARRIGKTVWEMSKLPRLWPELIRRAQLDELWVPNLFNAELFAGLAPITRVVPHAHFDISLMPRCKTPSFTFYSIFQWQPRKNPEALITAFALEFERGEAQLLLHSADADFAATRNRVHEVVASLRIPHPPQIVVSTGFVKHAAEIHRMGDVYVAAHRAEGWGLPLSEAMLAGRPVVATGWSGNMAFMNEGNSYPVGYHMTPVWGFEPRWDGTQLWAEIDIVDFRAQMREVFNQGEHGDGVRHRIANARQTIDPFVIGNMEVPVL